MRKNLTRALIATCVTMIVLMMICWIFVGRNDWYTWQTKQAFFGSGFEIVNKPGWFWKGFATCTTYPDVIEIYGTKDKTRGSSGDDSAQAHFNDGGSADFDWYARIRTPKPTVDASPEEIAKIEVKQRAFHRMVRSPDQARIMFRSHVRNCVGLAGQLMSASENQAARVAEFYQASNGQIKDGLYDMKKVTIRRKGGVADLMKAADKASTVPATVGNGEIPLKAEEVKKVRTSSGIALSQQQEVVVGEESVEASDTVRAAEIVRDKEGQPVISQPSPLIEYGGAQVQFSISKVEYDSGTVAKFKEKRDLLLQAESARATAVKSAQERLKNIAEGNKSIAETEATANQEKAKKVIGAQMLAEVEGILTKLKEVNGQTKVKTAAVMEKQLGAERDAAAFDAKAAENARKAAEIKAKATEQLIALGGAVSEAEQTLQEVYTKRIEDVAGSLATLKVPDVVIISMDAVPDGKSPLSMALPSLGLLEAAGLNKPLTEDVQSTWKPVVTGEMPKIVLPKIELSVPKADSAKPAVPKPEKAPARAPAEATK